jgi:hypothetical protein
MSLDQLELLWRHAAREVRQTLHDAALDARLPGSWLAQRVLDAVEAWRVETTPAAGCLSCPADLLRFQQRLQAMADSMLLYARALQERWDALSLR